MPVLFIIIALLALVFGPQWWAKYTFKRYSHRQDHIPGTGGELARHLLDRFEMPAVKVEITEKGDHYDPEAKIVRLSAENYNDNSLTAVAIAAHEVGHAIQDDRKESKLILRTNLVQIAQKAGKIGSIAMFVLPIVMLLTRSPTAGIIMGLIAFLSMAGATLVHLVTLPVEWDASFGKALPILKEGYIQEQDHAAVERILKAAAFTYVAASLASLLSFWRWAALLRR